MNTNDTVETPAIEPIVVPTAEQIDEALRILAVARTAKKAIKGKKAVELRPCMCGCGTMVARRFKAGHDARLKSILINAFRAGVLVNEREPMDIAKEHGWEKFLTEGRQPKPRKEKVAKPSKDGPAPDPKKQKAIIGRWEYEGELRGTSFFYHDREGNELEATKFKLV